MDNQFVAKRDALHPLYVRIAASRDREALTDLVTSYGSKVYVLIYRIIQGYGEREDAEELASDVFLKVWEDIGDFDPTRGSFAKWINMKAKYVALDFRRRVTRQSSIMRSFLEGIILECQEDLRIRQYESSLDNLNREEILRLLVEAVKLLPEDKQELIILRFVENKSYLEISQITKKPLGSVKSNIHRVLKYLRQVIIAQVSEEKTSV